MHPGDRQGGGEEVDDDEPFVVYSIASEHSSYALAPCRVGPTRSQAIIDSGAIPNILSRSLYDFVVEASKNDGYSLRPSKAKLQGVTGDPVAVDGLVTLPCELGSETMEIDFLVVREERLRLPQGLDVLIGIVWLCQTGVTINFGTGAMFLKDKFLLTCDGLANTNGVFTVLPVTTQSPPPSDADGPGEVTYDREFCAKVDSFPAIPPHHVAVVWATTGTALENGRDTLVHGSQLADGVTILDSVVTPAGGRIPLTFCNRSDEYFNVPRETGIWAVTDDRFSGWQAPDIDELTRVNLLHVMGIMVEAKPCPDGEEDTDPLHHELNSFDPANDAMRATGYDPERFARLLEALRHQDWNLTSSQKQKATRMLKEKQSAFNLLGEPLGRTSLVEHEVVTTCDRPVFTRPRFVPMKARPAIEQEIRGLLDQGHIRPSTSPWNAPIVVVKRKDGRCRLCVDYRLLNKNSDLQWFPLPHIESILFDCASKSVFSTLDLRSGYHQVPVAEDSIEKTAFSTHQGHYEWLALPFGLSGAPATFQNLMSAVLSGLLGNGVSVFLDDVAVHSRSVDEHLEALGEVLDRLIASGLQASPEKTFLFRGEVQLLGHTVGRNVVRPSLDKTAAIKQFPRPTDVKGVQAWLGLSGFYRRFIRSYADIARPLTQLLRKDVPFVWSDEQEQAFSALKASLSSNPVLRAPDFSKDWHLYTDASGHAIGSVLTQDADMDGKTVQLPVAYFSRALRGAEFNYPAVEQEALSIVESLKKFRPLIYNSRVIVWSDNKALSWLFERAHDRNSRIARWTLSLQEANAVVKYVPGDKNVIADRLSRIRFDTTNTSASPPLETDALEPLAVAFLDQLCDSRVELLGDVGAAPSGRLGVLTVQQGRDLPATPTHWTPEDLKDRQGRDPLYGNVVRYLLSNDPQDLRLVDVGVRRDIDSYFLAQGILYKRQLPRDAPLRDYEEVIIVPEGLRDTVIRAEHADPLSGHGAKDRTLWRLKRKFSWRGMEKDVQRFVRSCIVCHKFKGKQHPLTTLGRVPLPDRKFSLVAVDLMGPLPLTEAGNRYILLCVDYSTRFVIVNPLRSKSAKEVADAIWDSIVKFWGCPEVLVSDQGSEFRNQVLARLTELAGFSQHHTTIYHAASNGLAERSNAQLLSIIRGLVADAESTWDQHLGTAQIALNTAYHSSIGDTPYYVCFGVDPISPSAAFSDLSPKYCVDERATHTFRIYQRVKEIMEKAASDRERRRERTARVTELALDQRVFIKRLKKKGDSKLSPRWRGPYRIIQLIKPNVYRLQEVGSNRRTVAHLEGMKICPESLISRDDAPRARVIYRHQPALNRTHQDGMDAEVASDAEDDDPDFHTPPPRPGPRVAPHVDLRSPSPGSFDSRTMDPPTTVQYSPPPTPFDSLPRRSTSVSFSSSSAADAPGTPAPGPSVASGDGGTSQQSPLPRRPTSEASARISSSRSSVTLPHSPPSFSMASPSQHGADEECMDDVYVREVTIDTHPDVFTQDPPRRSSRSTVHPPGFYKGMAKP